MDPKSLLQHLVETESPSRDKAAVDRVGTIFVVPLGIPVLDRLGALGEGYHSEREYIFADSLEQRAKLVSALLKNW